MGNKRKEQELEREKAKMECVSFRCPRVRNGCVRISGITRRGEAATKTLLITGPGEQKKGGGGARQY